MHRLLHSTKLARCHQSVLLQIPSDLREGDLVRLLQLLIDHHGALRLRLGPDHNLQIGPRGSVQARDCITIVDFAGSTESTAAAALEAELRLDPETGKMVQGVWFQKDSRLLLMVHHLAVDGVSWRILLADLAAAWSAMVRGEVPVLDPEATPFRRWATYLSERASQQSLLSELGYWKNALCGPQLLPGKILNPEKDNISSAGNLRISLPVDLTTDLLTAVPQAFHAQINDVLLTGLALAALQWRRAYSAADDHTITIDLEGHGREPMDSGLDLSRTVGWFTSVFPVRLDLKGIELDEALAGKTDVARALKLIKDQLRAVPGHGLNYGLLRYLNSAAGQELAVLSGPQLSFNYLGRFAAQESALWLPTG